MPTFDNATVPVLPNSPPEDFVDRRTRSESGMGAERRQFSNSYEGLSPEAAILGEAVDRYKMRNRRRFITYEEILSVIQELGYTRG